MVPTSQERWYFPDPPKGTRPKKLYFEKYGAGAVLNCQVLVHSPFGFAFAWGDDTEVAKGFWGKDAESQAVKYVEALGYVQSVDWQLPPPAN
jgi:hypothetical protein